LNIFEEIIDGLLSSNFAFSKENYKDSLYSNIQIEEIKNINKNELLQKLKSKFPEL
jgi:hypothetical protein